MFKKVTTINQLRTLSKRTKNFKEEFSKSMESVKSLVNNRFDLMAFNEKSIVTNKKNATEDEIQELKNSIKVIDSLIDLNKLTKATIKDYSNPNTFMQNHCKSTHYGFQISKCKNEACNLCSIPTCLSPDIFDSLSFLPDPLLDETKDHFQSFEKLFGTKTTKKDQPSLKFGFKASEIDKANKELLLAQKVSDVVECSTCKRPRCIYSNEKLNHRDIIIIQQVKDENIYICGCSLFPPGHEQVTTIVVKSLFCAKFHQWKPHTTQSKILHILLFAFTVEEINPVFATIP